MGEDICKRRCGSFQDSLVAISSRSSAGASAPLAGGSWMFDINGAKQGVMRGRDLRSRVTGITIIVLFLTESRPIF